MTLALALLYLSAGVVGGIVNAAAGGAKLFVFPMLLAAGLPPLTANVTGTVALWPALVPAIWVYRDKLVHERRRLLRGATPALIGALAGALALIFGGEGAFTSLVPVFLTVAVVAIIFGDRLAVFGMKVGLARPAGVAAILLGSGFYGGYFGAGLGFMLIAAFTLAGSSDPQDANARKTLYATLINTTAVIPMMFTDLVNWPAAFLIAAGGLIGGYGGAHVTRRLPARPMRWMVATVGALLTLNFLFG